MAVQAAHLPRPAPASVGWGPPRRGPAPRRGAVRAGPSRPRHARRHRGAVRSTFAVTPLALLVGMLVVTAGFMVGIARAVALVPSVDGVVSGRRRHASRAVSARSGQRVGLGLAVIVMLFSVGLLYVDRSVHITTRNIDLEALAAEHDELARRQRSLESDLARLGSDVAVGHEALDRGLARLGPPILVPAR